ncbi:hypothetical protein PIB30_035717, partial [Stylosanthes scabra]|nr:hypothetical protein [Stylosanthes scabra]
AGNMQSRSNATHKNDACLILVQAMSSCVGWLPAPGDYFRITPKYGLLTVKCRGPSPMRPALPVGVRTYPRYVVEEGSNSSHDKSLVPERVRIPSPESYKASKTASTVRNR